MAAATAVAAAAVATEAGAAAEVATLPFSFGTFFGGGLMSGAQKLLTPVPM